LPPPAPKAPSAQLAPQPPPRIEAPPPAKVARNEDTQPSAAPAPREPGDQPTRPMSMDELAAAERAYFARAHGSSTPPAETRPVPAPPPLPTSARPDQKQRASRPP